jgi:uncharacterized RDD family membrane protein YckC
MPAAPPPVAPARRSAAARDGAVAIETPELVEVTYTVAGVGSRLLAGLVDLVLAALLVAAVSFLALAAASAMRRFGVALVAGPWFFAVWVLTVFGVAWGYGVLFEVLGDGRTPGKRLLGLRVVMDGGYSVTLGASAVRNLLRVVDAQPIPLYVVGLVGVVASRRGRRLGDVVAGTVVVRERTVRERAAPAAPAPAPPAAASGEQGAPSPRITLLDDERFALLERFVARRAALDPGRAAALEARLVAAVGPALDALAREEEERPRRGRLTPRPGARPHSSACSPASAPRARPAPRWRARAARAAGGTRSSPRGASAGAASPRASPRPAAAGSPPSPKTR